MELTPYPWVSTPLPNEQLPSTPVHRAFTSCLLTEVFLNLHDDASKGADELVRAGAFTAQWQHKGDGDRQVDSGWDLSFDRPIDRSNKVVRVDQSVNSYLRVPVVMRASHSMYVCAYTGPNIHRQMYVVCWVATTKSRAYVTPHWAYLRIKFARHSLHYSFT